MIFRGSFGVFRDFFADLLTKISVSDVCAKSGVGGPTENWLQVRNDTTKRKNSNSSHFKGRHR